MSYFDYTDIIAILVVIAGFIFAGIMFQSGAIDVNTFVVVIIGVFSTIMMKYAVPLAMAQLIQKIYGKGMTAYWNEIKKEISETPREYGFSIDLMLPDKYLPIHNTALPAWDLALFDINRDDMAIYLGERQDILDYPYPHITIIFKPSNNKILYTYRGDLDNAIKFIRENADAFIEEGKQVIIPELIREMRFGEGISAKIPTEGATNAGTK